MANELGLRNVSFEVGGIGGIGGIGEYENSLRMAYVRGPQRVIVSLFAQIG
jgi:hypothetical protein